MSAQNRAELSESSGEELTINLSPRKTKKSNIKRRRPVITDDDEDITPIPTNPPSEIAPKKSKAGKENKSPFKEPKTPKTKVPNSMLDDNEVQWQRGMDMAVRLLVPLKVDTKNLTLLPDSGTLECFKKAAASWLTERHHFVSLTYSTQNSLNTIMARFLLDFVLKSAELTPAGWNPHGCVIWNHRCSYKDGLKCFHGTQMITRDHVIEMNVSSENAQRALKETPEKAKVTTNRFGRNVVQLRNNDASCCKFDVNSPSGMFSSKSCALFYTEGKKALQALMQAQAFQKACYPKMGRNSNYLLMPLQCDCNWGSKVPLLGRQMCKLTPYALPVADNLKAEEVSDPKILATIENPAVMVFQCCNPVYRGGRGNQSKNCDLKISAPDVISALQLTKKMWASIFESTAPVTVPEFKWGPQFEYQTTILPTGEEDADDSLF